MTFRSTTQGTSKARATKSTTESHGAVLTEGRTGWIGPPTFRMMVETECIWLQLHPAGPAEGEQEPDTLGRRERASAYLHALPQLCGPRQRPRGRSRPAGRS